MSRKSAVVGSGAGTSDCATPIEADRPAYPPQLMRRAVAPLLAIAVIAIVVIGLSQASGGGTEAKQPRFDLDKALAELQGAPAPLASLHEQHSQLLDGGVKAINARLGDLKGHPVVINKWGSWCYPCRQEFPFFQRAGAEYGKRVAFLGVDGKDNVGEARAFMREFPLPFPSYRDDDEDIARELEIPANYPITLFIGADGKPAFTHQGQYKTYAALQEDIKRYLRA